MSLQFDDNVLGKQVKQQPPQTYQILLNEEFSNQQLNFDSQDSYLRAKLPKDNSLNFEPNTNLREQISLIQQHLEQQQIQFKQEKQQERKKINVQKFSEIQDIEKNRRPATAQHEEDYLPYSQKGTLFTPDNKFAFIIDPQLHPLNTLLTPRINSIKKTKEPLPSVYHSANWHYVRRVPKLFEQIKKIDETSRSRSPTRASSPLGTVRTKFETMTAKPDQTFDSAPTVFHKGTRISSAHKENNTTHNNYINISNNFQTNLPQRPKTSVLPKRMIISNRELENSSARNNTAGPDDDKRRPQTVHYQK